MHSPFYVTLFALVQIIHGEINQDAATQVTWEYSHHSLARCFLERISRTALWFGENSNKTPEGKQKEEEKSSGNMFCSWFNPKMGSSSSSWVWLRSDHIRTTPGFVCTDTVSSRRSSSVQFICARVNVAAPLRCAPKATKGGKQSLARFSRTKWATYKTAPGVKVCA